MELFQQVVPYHRHTHKTNKLIFLQSLWDQTNWAGSSTLSIAPIFLVCRRTNCFKTKTKNACTKILSGGIHVFCWFLFLIRPPVRRARRRQMELGNVTFLSKGNDEKTRGKWGGALSAWGIKEKNKKYGSALMATQHAHCHTQNWPFFLDPVVINERFVSFFRGVWQDRAGRSPKCLRLHRHVGISSLQCNFNAVPSPCYYYYYYSLFLFRF